MKSSQIVFLGLALIVGAQYSSASHYNHNCGLGAGHNPCSCSEIVVKAAKPVRPVKFVDPALITEANAARAATHPTSVTKGCGSHSSSSSSGVSVIDLLKPSCGPIAPKFDPIYNLCHKHRCHGITEVTPAYPVTPPCSTCGKKVCSCEAAHDPPCSHCGSRHGCSCAYSELQKFPEDEGLSFDEQESIYNGNCAPAAPADPVSVALAYGYAQRRANCIPEAKLSLGHTSVPIDGSVRKTQVDIPEEKLLIIERPIVELKYSSKACPSRAKYNELVAQQEALEAQRLELESQARSDDPSQSFISYSDIGYGPVAPSKNQFVNTESGSAGSSSHLTFDDTPCGQLGKPIPGYRSGNVIVREDPVEYDEYERDNISYDPDSSSEEAEQYSAGVGLLARLRARAHGCGCSK